MLSICVSMHALNMCELFSKILPLFDITFMLPTVRHINSAMYPFCLINFWLEHERLLMRGLLFDGIFRSYGSLHLGKEHYKVQACLSKR